MRILDFRIGKVRARVARLQERLRLAARLSSTASFVRICRALNLSGARSGDGDTSEDAHIDNNIQLQHT